MTRQSSDQQLVCEDCGSAFSFTVPEQVFYAERGFRQPERCGECRARRRAERNAEIIASYESLTGAAAWPETFATYGGQRDRDRNRGGARDHSPGSHRSRGNGAGASAASYRATCAACRRDTEVPFQPRMGRPVYCRECFNQRRGR